MESKLTPEQKLKLLSLLRENIPAWEIDRYLMDCGLRFREATKTRRIASDYLGKSTS